MRFKSFKIILSSTLDVSIFDNLDVSKIILSSTLNVCTLDDGQLRDNNSKHICDLYGLFGLDQLIREPTRVTLDTSTTIDHIATSSPRNILKSGVCKVTMSDHYMVYCVRKFNGNLKKDHKNIRTRMMKNFSEEAFLNDVATIDWEQVLGHSDDINALVNNWSSIFSAIIEKHAPLRQIRVSERYCPWVNANLKGLIQTRDRLKKAAVKCNSQILMASYKQVRNRVNSLNLTLKRQYFSEKISMQQGNMKESWKTINQLLNKRSKTTSIESLKDDKGNNIVDKQEIAETMNKFFCSIGKDLAKNIKEKPNPLLSGEYQINKEGKTFRFGAVSEQNIGDAIGRSRLRRVLAMTISQAISSS